MTDIHIPYFPEYEAPAGYDPYEDGPILRALDKLQNAVDAEIKQEKEGAH